MTVCSLTSRLDRQVDWFRRHDEEQQRISLWTDVKDSTALISMQDIWNNNVPGSSSACIRFSLDTSLIRVLA